MALESKSKEGREKSLATIEMESCYLRGEGGGICRIETFAATDYLGSRFWVEWKPPMVKGRDGGRLIGS